MRIVFVVAALACVAVLGTGLYWQQKLAPIMKAKGSAVVPVSMTLPQPGAVREIDLGFESFAIPAAIVGQPLQHDDSLFISVKESATAEAGLTICPLASDDDAEVRKVLHQFEALTGERIDSYWAFRKRALYTQPFSIWTVPFRGFRRSVTDVTLLAAKGMEFGSVDRIWIYEDENLGITMTPRHETMFIDLHDKRSRAWQSFLLSIDPIAPQEVLAALVNSYRIKTTDFSADSLRAQLRAAGVGQWISPPSEEVVSMDEEERLRRVAEEVKARRARREAEERSGPGR